jgi:putative peptidoglycan lipid II flippase
MLKGILTVGGWTMASRVLGLLREQLIAYLVGAGPVADAFFLANRIPNLFRRLFGEGAFNAAFVPSFAGILQKDGKGAAQRFAEQAASVLLFWLVGLTVLAEIFMPQVISVLLAGTTADPDKFALIVALARITFPYMPLICVAALFSGVLNSLHKFAAAAAAPVVYNLVSIATMLLLAHRAPTPSHALAWGVSLSGVVQLALLVWAVRRAGLRITLPRPRLSADMRLLFRRMAPGLLGAGVAQFSQLVDAFIISFLPTSTASVLNYADRVNQLPLGVIGVAIGTALLPTLSRQAQAGDSAGAHASLNRAMEYALVLTIPATLGLIFAAVPIVGVLFQHGAFAASDTAATATALAVYAAGLPAFVLVKVLTPPFFARGDTATPVRVAMFAVAVNIALNIALMGPLGYLGPAAASSGAAWLNIAALALLLRRRGYIAVDSVLARRLPRIILAAAAMGACIWAIQRTLPGQGDFAVRLTALAALIGGGMAAYAIAGEVLGAFRIRDLLRGRK